MLPFIKRQASRSILLMALTALADCGATAAQEDIATTSSAVHAAQSDWISCQSRVESDPAFVSLREKIRLSTHDDILLEQRANDDVPTLREVQLLYAWDRANERCRAAYVEAAQEGFTYETDPIETSYDMVDAIYLDLAKGRSTWAQANARLAASKRAIRKMMYDAAAPYAEQKEAENQQELEQRAATWNSIIQGVSAVATAVAENPPESGYCSWSGCTYRRGW